MKKHNGMRPHDIVILLKIIAKGNNSWYMKDLAQELFISHSEVSESLTRSVYSGLISSDKKRVMKTALLDYIKYGLKYSYPQKPGSQIRGTATAYSAPPLSNLIQSNEPIVWPDPEGNIRGQSIIPLHPNVPEAVKIDAKLYELLALTDAIRVGNVREQKIAFEEIEKRF